MTVTVKPGDKKVRIISKDEEVPMCEVKIKDILYEGRIIEMSSNGTYKIELLKEV